MNPQKIQEILNLNKEFYNTVQNEFSKTRQSGWKGWDTVAKIINQEFKSNQKSNNKVTVLDLGCGNGRFFEYITKKTPPINLSYFGVDNNDFLLNEAENKYKLNNNATFRNIDIFTNLTSINNTFDIVAVFGVMHHIPDPQFRLAWLNKLATLINTNGILILTFWDVLEQNPQKAPDLDENDFYVGWNNLDNTKRYCHYYDEKELNIIKNAMEQNKLLLIKEFNDDGKNQNSNKYLIFKKHE